MSTARNRSPWSRVAIVTGGSRGVGRATIRRLAAGGCAVVVNYLHDQRAAELTVSAILARNGNAVAVRADIADDVDVHRLFAETTAAFGGIDVLVHAAGSAITASAPAEADLVEFDALVRVDAGRVRRQPGSSASPSRWRRDRQPVGLGGGLIPADLRPLRGHQGRHRRAHPIAGARTARA